MCTDADYDLAKEARAKRKERITRTSVGTHRTLRRLRVGTGTRKRDIDRTLATTQTRTTNMGKFDRVLDDEKKLRG